VVEPPPEDDSPPDEEPGEESDEEPELPDEESPPDEEPEPEDPALPPPDDELLLPRKSVTYQPLPLSWKPAAVTCLLKASLPQFGQTVKGASEIFCSTSLA
jgi:hypothetical protein